VFLVHHKEQGFFTLFVDALAVCTSDSFEKSFGLLFVTYYVFNLVVAKNMRKTIAFLQKYACSMTDDGSDQNMSRAQQHCVALMEKLTLKPLSRPTCRKLRGKKNGSCTEPNLVKAITSCSPENAEEVPVSTDITLISLEALHDNNDASINSESASPPNSENISNAEL